MDSGGGGGNGRALQVTEFAAARALEARSPLLLRPPPRCRLVSCRRQCGDARGHLGTPLSRLPLPLRYGGVP